MPISAEDKIEKNGAGIDSRKLTVTFTNGSVDQIEELKNFLKLESCLDVIKLGISFLQRIKDDEDKTKKSDSDSPQAKV